MINTISRSDDIYTIMLGIRYLFTETIFTIIRIYSTLLRLLSSENVRYCILDLGLQLGYNFPTKYVMCNSILCRQDQNDQSKDKGNDEYASVTTSDMPTQLIS